MIKKWLIIAAVVLLLIVLLIWLFVASAKPLPGTKIDDLGRGHVPVGEKVDYNSNPPTSGKHYEDWIKSGVYPQAQEDGYLVHSLEHGYVIMHYKCQIDSQEASCEARKDQLAKVYDKKGKTRLIVVPRPNLDTNFALTAWGYLDKFDQFDGSRIEKFIDAHLNMGPEKTMEQ